jgi:protoporphyrinogen oxidase
VFVVFAALTPPKRCIWSAQIKFQRPSKVGFGNNLINPRNKKSMEKDPIVIVGSGLAGLACALLLKRKGIPVLVLEKEAHIGGRLNTIETSDGFTLDVGFQVLLNSYPELNGLIDLHQLHLKKFNSGALILKKEQGQIKHYLLANPLVHPARAIWELFSNQVELSDQVLVLKLISRAHSQVQTLNPALSTLDFLSNFGFSQRFINTFWKPFLTGVFLDPDLSVDSEYFLFLIKCFSGGFVSIPEKGMSMIPQQMAAEIGFENIRNSVSVSHFNAKEVFLPNGEIIKASAVVCAYNLAAESRRFLGVTTHYFSTEQDIPWDKWLVLIPPEMGLKINHLAVVSHVNPNYSKNGKHLLSVSEVGTSSEANEIQKEVQSLLPPSVKLEIVKSIQVQRALPKVNLKPQGYEFKDGIFYCGDHLSSPSINGALRSGRMVSEHVLKSLQSKSAQVSSAGGLA